MMRRSILALLLAAASLSATAQTIYKCTDAAGGTLISNSKSGKNCVAVTSSADSSIAAPKARSGAAANPSPANFPRVQEGDQRARDTDRKRILDQELAGEQRNLEQAKQSLAEQEAIRNGDERNYQRVLERLQPYKDRVAQHERNLQAIQKELNNLR